MNPQLQVVPPGVQPTGCCPPFFNPDRYEEQEFIWTNKLFVKDHVVSLLHVPLNMSRRMTKDRELIEKAGAQPPQPLMLADERSLWGADLFIDVTKPVPGVEMATLSGRFLTRVFEGDYSEAPKWVARMKSWLSARDEKLERIYFGYVMCPACAKAYGKNEVVLFAKVADRRPLIAAA
jgi:hypothetical protein